MLSERSQSLKNTFLVYYLWLNIKDYWKKPPFELTVYKNIARILLFTLHASSL